MNNRKESNIDPIFERRLSNRFNEIRTYYGKSFFQDVLSVENLVGYEKDKVKAHEELSGWKEGKRLELKSVNMSSTEQNLHGDIVDDLDFTSLALTSSEMMQYYDKERHINPGHPEDEERYEVVGYRLWEYYYSITSELAEEERAIKEAEYILKSSKKS